MLRSVLRRAAVFVAFLLAFASLAPVALWAAQLVEAPAPAGPPDWHPIVAGLVTAAAAALSPVLTYGLRISFRRIPRIALPFVSMLLAGPTATWLLGAIAPIAARGYWQGIGVGLAGWAIRELVNTWREHGAAA